MDAHRDVDATMTTVHQALDAFVRGDADPLEEAYSHRDDVSLANPFGPPVRGWADARATMDRAATYYRDGRATGFDRIAEFVTSDLAYVVEIEHYEARVGGSEDQVPVTLRVTTVLRPEDGSWRIAHRHADPITTAQAAGSVVGTST
jgi:ketosteroid isomerase-like protein